MAGIDVSNLKAAEVQQTVGSGGLANEFGGIAELAGAFVQGVAGIHGHIKTKQATAKAADDAAKVAQFQVGQLEQTVEQQEALVESAFTDEELSKFKASTDLNERLKMAESKGVSQNLIEVRRQKALADAISRDPANRAEYVKIFKDVKSATDHSLDSQINAQDKAIAQAQAAETGRRTQLLMQNGYVTTTEGLTPERVDGLYKASGLETLEVKINDADLQLRLQEKGMALTENNIKNELRLFEQENPEVVPGFVGTTVTATLGNLRNMKNADQATRNQLVAQARAGVISDLSAKTGLSAADVASRYSPLLSQFDSLNNYDPNSEQAAVVETRLKLASTMRLEGLLENDPDLQKLKSLQDGLPVMFRDVGVQGQAGRMLTNSFINVMEGGDTLLDRRGILNAVNQDPDGVAKFFGTAMESVAFDEPVTEVQAASLTSMSEVLSLNYGQENSAKIYGRVLPYLSSPRMAEAWAAAKSSSPDPEQVELSLRKTGRNLSLFIDDSISSIGAVLGTTPQFEINEEAGEIKVNSTNRTVQANVAKINQTIKALAHMEGHTDYAKVLREGEF